MKCQVPPKRFSLYVTVSLLAFLTVGISPARAESAFSSHHGAKNKSTSSSSSETLITAQEMTSDAKTSIVTATGKVEIARGGYILHADLVTFNQKTNVMRAEGHVAILSPTGEVAFAEAEEVTGDMKQAFAENVAILFPDNSRMMAKTAQRYGGRYLVADQGAYTACNVCKNNPDTPPLWQLHAKQIVQDNEEHNIYYHDATLQMMGIPFFYTPYMSSPDPTVDRRQGFLTPTPGISSNVGAFIRTPYYFDISPDADATLAPTFSQKDKVQIAGNIRKRFEQGGLDFDGSFTHTDLISETGVDEGQQWRGHLFGSFLYNLDNVWRAGADVQMASDKSYLQRYNYSSLDELTDRFYVEGFKGRDYAAINSYYFEDLRVGTQPVQPLVLPQASFSALGEPGKTFGGRWSFDGNMLVTSRDNYNQSISQQGPDTRRLSLDAGWQRQFISDTGLVTQLSGMIRGDSYSADNVINPDGSGRNYDNVLFARQFEQANAVFRYPMSRSGNGYQQTLEPIASFIAAPAIHTRSDQPIEDSLDVQFDETNLFAANRYTGYDLIEGGSRATYGLRHAITTDSGGHIDMFGGQSFDLNRNSTFPDQSGLEDKTSDYVGRIEFVPTNWFTANYGFRLDHNTFSPQRQDAIVSAGAPIFRPYAHYLSGDITDTLGETVDNKEVIMGFASHFQKYWQLNIDHTQAFSPDPGPRGTTAVLTYADECYIFGVSLNHTDLNRVDINSGTSVMFHFFLKNLGGVHTDSYSPNGDAFPAQFRHTN